MRTRTTAPALRPASSRLRDNTPDVVEASSTSLAPARPLSGHQFSRVVPYAQRAGEIPPETAVQAKLEISQPGDLYELEADRVADQVMGKDDRSAEDEEQFEDAKARSKVQRKESGPGVRVPEQVVAVTRSSGQPLDAETRAFMEPRFGFDFGHVRIHADSESAEAARSINARAYTLGSDVVFGSGLFAPHASEGQRLLAHELAHVVQQGNAAPSETTTSEQGVVVSKTSSPSISRTISPNYSSIVSNLSYGAVDWAITDEEAKQVLDWLQALSPTDLTDTVVQLQTDGKLDRLLDNVSAADRATYAALIASIQQARTRAQTLARIQKLLSYGILDWAITDEEAHEVLENLQNLPDDRRRVVVEQLVASGHYDRLIGNVSAADRATFAALLTQLDAFRRGRNDPMLGTSLPGAAAATATGTALNAGVATNPATGAPVPFVDTVGGRTYRQDIEDKLDGVRAWMFAQSQAMLARPKLPMARFEGIGQEAKRQTDALFGGFAKGPALSTAGPNPTLIDRSLQPPDRADLVRYLINNQAELLPVHTAHSAIPSRGSAADATTELGIITSIIPAYAAAHGAELDVIDQAWPGIASGGVVQIQPFEDTTPAGTRRMLWENFQTMIHEYLHTITHPGYEQLAHSLGGTKQSILIEGGTSLFTDKVWKLIFPEEIRANEQLRLNVEGSTLPFDATVIPPISHYNQIAEARTIESAVGEENMRAAYFLGHTELLSLGTSYSPAAAARGHAYVVPAAGIATVADVATATGAAAADIATANGLSAGDAVTPGQQLTVPGIRIHVVRADGTETKADIARENGVTEADLDRANVGFNWGALAPGQSIVIPVH
jgi:hypothetical protein